MSGKAAKISLTDRMFEILTKLSSSRNAGVAIALRASVILLAFQKRINHEIANRLGISSDTVGLWRRR